MNGHILQRQNMPMRKILSLVFLFLSLTWLVLPHEVPAAGLYYWKDKDGNMQISDIPPQSPNEQDKMKSVIAPEEASTALRKAGRQKTAHSGVPGYAQKEVTIYTNTT
jgi:hypothetical protein